MVAEGRCSAAVPVRPGLGDVPAGSVDLGVGDWVGTGVGRDTDRPDRRLAAAAGRNLHSRRCGWLRSAGRRTAGRQELHDGRCEEGQPASRPTGPVGAVLAVVEPDPIGELTCLAPRTLVRLGLPVAELAHVRVDAGDRVDAGGVGGDGDSELADPLCLAKAITGRPRHYAPLVKAVVKGRADCGPCRGISNVEELWARRRSPTASTSRTRDGACVAEALCRLPRTGGAAPPGLIWSWPDVEAWARPRVDCRRS